jgi:HSP20 family molecular chaperone IbpA
MSFTLPENVDPNKVTVTCKDRDLIVRAEDKIEEKDRMSQFSYYKRSTLPDHTDFSKISCSLDKNKLSVTAPLKNDVELSLRQIPIQSIKN